MAHAFVKERRPRAAGRCAFLGLETGETAECESCNGRVRLKLRACAVHGLCTQEKTVNGYACCAGCPDRKARPILQTWSASAGIGDHLLALPIAEGLRRQYPGCEIVVAAPAWLHPWLRWFGGYDRLVIEPVKAPVCFCDNVGDWDTFTKAGKSRWEFWGEKFGVRPTLPEVRPVSRSAAEWAVPYTHRIALAPFASQGNRTWPLARWLEVERRLLALGFEVVVLDDKPDRCDRFKGSKLLGQPAERVTAVVRGALCFVGNDSGMAHVAGMSGVRGVCVSSRVSDVRIVGLYPTVEELGGKAAGFERVRPEDVVRAVLGQVRRAVDPEFPVSRFLDALPEADRWRRECWPPIYAALWKTVKALAPRTAVEIGTRAGAGSWTILDAAPGCRLDTIDLPAPGGGGLEGAEEHARALLAGRPVTFHAADSRTFHRLPVLDADLVYVDGDHFEATALSDLELAERSGAKAILCDDLSNFASVRAACAHFLRSRPHLRSEFIPSQTGLLLITGADP